MGHLLELWSATYANHPALRTAVDFMHVGGLLASGGCAVAADLATLSTDAANAEARRAHLSLLQRTHAIVIAGLMLVTISGLLLLAADLETFLSSKVFWLKMALIALLLVNGFLMQGGKRHARRDDAVGWMRLRRMASISLLLWFLTTLAGTALPNIG
jgi:uncharacterized membrane protein